MPFLASRPGRGLASTLRCPDDGFDRPTWSLLPLHATDFEHRSRLSSDAVVRTGSWFQPCRETADTDRPRTVCKSRQSAGSETPTRSSATGRTRTKSKRPKPWRLHSAHYERADQAKIKTSRQSSATRHRAPCVKRKVRRANSLPRSVKFPVMCVVLMVPEEVFEPHSFWARAMAVGRGLIALTASRSNGATRARALSADSHTHCRLARAVKTCGKLSCTNSANAPRSGMQISRRPRSLKAMMLARASLESALLTVSNVSPR
jgi:hypothetical protein